MNITDPIRRHANATPNAPAIIRWNATITYRQFDRMLDGIARRILDLGFGPGDVVRLAFPDLPGSGAAFRFLVLSLAMARAGVGTTAADEFDDCLSACFSGEAGTATRAPRSVLVDDAWFESPPETVEVGIVPSHADGTTICRIVSTSGTTGTAKRVAVSHDIMVRRLEGGEALGPYPAEPVAIIHIGPWSNAGFRNVLRVLHAGGALVLARKPHEILRAIARHGVNYLFLAPAALASIVEVVPAGHGPFHGLEWVEVTGSYLPQPLYEQARARLCPNIVTSYGSTEAGNVASAKRSDLEEHPGAVGFVMPGVEVEAVDDDCRPLPPGVMGAIRIRSRTCVTGYFGDDETTSQTFRDGWFFPGDVGSVSVDRLLTIAGRKSDLINIGGNKISPRIIEEALLSVPGVVDAAAFGVPDAHGIPGIWAAIVVRGALAKGRLEATCRSLAFAGPKRVLRVEALPRNANGKVVREDLVKIALNASRSIQSGGE